MSLLSSMNKEMYNGWHAYGDSMVLLERLLIYRTFMIMEGAAVLCLTELPEFS